MDQDDVFWLVASRAWTCQYQVPLGSVAFQLVPDSQDD